MTEYGVRHYPHEWHGWDPVGTYNPDCPDCQRQLGEREALHDETLKEAEERELAEIIWDKTDGTDEDAPDVAARAIISAGYRKQRALE